MLKEYSLSVVLPNDQVFLLNKTLEFWNLSTEILVFSVSL